MENQVDEKVKNARSKQLRQLADRLTQKYFDSMVGRTQCVLAETIGDDGYVYGYGENYIRLKFKTENPVLNQFYQIKISGSDNQAAPQL